MLSASILNFFTVASGIVSGIIFGIVFSVASAVGPSALASGLDVQLKDLRKSYFYIGGAKEVSPGKGCTKLLGPDLKKYGRLTHCDPEDDHVMCKLKSGERVFAFEFEEACEASFKQGVSPTPSDD